MGLVRFYLVPKWYLVHIMKPTYSYAGKTNERLPLEVLVTAVMSDVTSTGKVDVVLLRQPKR